MSTAYRMLNMVFVFVVVVVVVVVVDTRNSFFSFKIVMVKIVSWLLCMWFLIYISLFLPSVLNLIFLLILSYCHSFPILFLPFLSLIFFLLKSVNEVF